MDEFPMLMSAYLTDTIYNFDKCKSTRKEECQPKPAVSQMENEQ